MPHYPENQSDKNLKKLRQNNVCAECGRQLYIYLDLKTKKEYVSCPTPGHEGIARRYEQKGEDYQSDIRRLTELEEKLDKNTVTALAKLPVRGQLTQPQAEHILSLVYPGCPKDEIVRCAILCRDFGLHPLMKEVYLIPFKDKDGKANYATVLGINATRKLMAQRGTFSYLDNTPRVMTEDEQKTIFGEVDDKNIVAITRLRTREGEEAQGYGKWPADKDPYGTDKGNTKANMAFIRSERNAFGRLFTDAIPQNIEIIDEAYVEGIGEVDKKTGEILESEKAGEEVLEGEFEEVLEGTPEAETEAESEAKPEAKAGMTPITVDQITHVSDLMRESGMDMAAMGKYFNVDKKWNVRRMKDLVRWQYDELVAEFTKT